MFTFDDNKCYRMPAHFGGWEFDPNAQARYNDVVALVYRITTDGARLAEYLPPGFELLAPELHIHYQQCRQVEWLAGSYYNVVTVAAPVRFQGRRDRLDGAFSLVVWENKTTPILTGNMMGVPKIYAAIEDLHIVNGTYRTRLSYEGSTFLELGMTGAAPLPSDAVRALAGEMNAFGWRYIPKVGGPGAELSQPILFPMHNYPSAAWQGAGTLAWSHMTWEQNPLQFHIINALAQLPVIEMAPVLMTHGRAVLTEARGRVLC